MSYVVRMPKLGVEMETGIVLEWHVAAGESVEDGDVVAEVESEKSTAEVAARESGVLRRVYLTEGAEAPPGTAMGIVAGPDEDVGDLEAEVDAEEGDEGGDADEAGADGAATGAGAAGDGTPAATATDASGAGPAAAGDDTDGGADVAPRTASGTIKATPKAKKRARDRGVDLARVEGTGPAGGITASDVEDAQVAGGATGGGDRTVREERELSGMRTTIADRLGESYRNAVHVTVDREVEVEAAFEAAEATDGSITDVFLVAVSATLDDHPEFNATFDADAGVHTLYEEHNVGVAVDLDGGLVTPVLSDVSGRSVSEVSALRGQVVDRVLDGDYTGDDLSGGTFTVSNLGVFGSDSFTPVINPPEVAILGVNRVTEEPVRTDRGIAFRRHVTFSLSFDHRVVDGADAARFLTTLDEHLADAGSLVEG